ncbi:hypothetical protein P7K49_032008, partial [Saguinus oedipus]
STPAQDPRLVCEQRTDVEDGKYTHTLASGLANELHEDLKMIPACGGLSCFRGLRVQRQYSETAGCHGQTA